MKNKVFITQSREGGAKGAKGHWNTPARTPWLPERVNCLRTCFCWPAIFRVWLQLIIGPNVRMVFFSRRGAETRF